MFRKSFSILCLLVLVVILSSCKTIPATPSQQTGLANPASVFCEQNGGKLDLRTDASGAVSGYCVFPDGSECEEWTYFRGECQVGDSLKKVIPSNMPETRRAQILFYSNRDNGYNNIFKLEIGKSNVTRLTENQSNTFSGPYSPDGKSLLFTGFGLTHSFVGVLNADGSGQKDLTNLSDSDDAFPSWSPDGNRILFTSRRDGNNEIYVMNADGSNPKRLTNNGKDDFAPAWSPDGKQIVFVSDRDNQTGIYSLYLMNPYGGDQSRLTNDQSNDYSPSWSPDGAKIVYQSMRQGQADVYVIDLATSVEINLTNNPSDDGSPSWSPDGAEIAFQTNRDGNWEIYLIDANGANPTNLTNNPADDQLPFWVP